MKERVLMNATACRYRIRFKERYKNSRMHKTLPYRPDIDGLRALAVLLVVAYHAFPSIVKAGFIGVDIFFVISGYLIGGIILTNLEANEFSFRNFYFRRILRIFPALVVVFLGILIIGYIYLLPDEFKNLGLSIVVGCIFGENFLLWHSAGYFDTAAHAKPLLNLWSLGIEEQFYIIFPLLLWISWKKRLRIFTLLTILALLSFVDCVWLRRVNPAADFYSPFTRFWELFVGCLLKAAEISPGFGKYKAYLNKIFTKIFYRDSTLSPDGLGLFLAICGFFVFGYTLVRIAPDSWYPGWLAIFPVSTALLLIAAGQSNPLSRNLLCNKVAVFIGKISYPLYLWHWPLLSFAWIINGHLDASTRMLRAALVFASFILASMTYLFVERPVRLHRCFGSGSLPLLLAGMISCCCMGSLIYYLQGLPDRTNLKIKHETLALLSKDLYDVYTNEAGLKYIGGDPEGLGYYRYNDLGLDETVAVYGDSHANAAYTGIAKLGEELRNSGGGFNTLCLGSGGVTAFYPTNIKKFVDIVAQNPKIKKIFLLTRGSSLILNNNFGPEKFTSIYKDLVNKLTQLNKDVIIVAENPTLRRDIRSAIIRKVNGLSINHDSLKQSRKEVEDREKKYYDILNELAGIPRVDVLDSIPAFCPSNNCLAYDDNDLPLYWDRDHLSVIGSDFQAQKIIKPWFEKKDKEN